MESGGKNGSVKSVRGVTSCLYPRRRRKIEECVEYFASVN